MPTEADLHSDRPPCLALVRRWSRVLVFILGGMMSGVLLPSAHAQLDSLRLKPMAPVAQVDGGLRLVRAGKVPEGLPLLEKGVAARPAHVHPDYGSAAYWLGEAYAQTGDSARARTTWRRGVDRLADAGRFDPRLADAYLRTLTLPQLRDERLQAVDVYTRLLGRVGTDTSSAIAPIYRRRIAQLAPLLPDDVFARVVEGERSAEPSTWTIRAGGGDALQTWWRSLDPFPATEENERLEEHLTRLVRARQSFGCPERPGALDARGVTHLRLGAPYKRRPLRYKDMEFFEEVFRFGVPIPPASFPDSEIWLYPQIDDATYFLFADSETSDCFETIRANDLLPNTLKMRRGDSDRGLNIAYSALMAMRAIYGQLALFHPDFGGRYNEIENYANRQEMNAMAAEVAEALGTDTQNGSGQSREVGTGVGQTRRVSSNPALGLPAPTEFVTRMLTRADEEDRQAVRRRKKETPRQYTALHEGTPELPVAVRTARFLTADGATRTEVYWGVAAADARLPSGDDGEAPAPSSIRFSAAWQNDDRSQTKRTNRRIRLASNPDRQGPIIVGTPVAFEGSSLHHLSMQWTQHQLLRAADSSVSGLGPKRRFTHARADSLNPLRTADEGLEMSDLKVLSLSDSVLKTTDKPTEQATPYPFRTLTPDTPLLLSFEIYHLTYGPDDRTDYNISYEVEGETQRGWTRLFRGQDTERTRTTMAREGTSRRSDEQILLDLSEIERKEPQTVRVTVRVTDEQTGTTVSRSLDFRLQSPGES